MRAANAFLHRRNILNKPVLYIKSKRLVEMSLTDYDDRRNLIIILEINQTILPCIIC